MAEKTILSNIDNDEAIASFLLVCVFVLKTAPLQKNMVSFHRNGATKSTHRQISHATISSKKLTFFLVAELI